MTNAGRSSGAFHLAALCLTRTIVAGEIPAQEKSVQWWQRRYADAPSLACAIYAERLKLEKDPQHAEELVSLLIKKHVIFKDSDGTVVTVRDAAADVFEEMADRDYWLNESAAVKLIACCPLDGGDCARIHVPAYTEKQFSKLRRKLRSNLRTKSGSVYPPAASEQRIE